MVISITFISSERSYMDYTRMPSLIYRYLINLVVSFPIRSGPGVFMNVSVRVNCAFNNYIFLCDKVYYSNTIIITILM